MGYWQPSPDIFIRPPPASSALPLSERFAKYPPHEMPPDCPAQLMAQMDRNFSALAQLKRTSANAGLEQMLNCQPPPRSSANAGLEQMLNCPPPPIRPLLPPFPMNMARAASLINVNDYPFNPLASQKVPHQVTRTIMSHDLSAPRQANSTRLRLDFSNKKNKEQLVQQYGLTVPKPNPQPQPCVLHPREIEKNPANPANPANAANFKVPVALSDREKIFYEKMKADLAKKLQERKNNPPPEWTCYDRDQCVKEYLVYHETRAKQMSRDVLKYELDELKSIYNHN